MLLAVACAAAASAAAAGAERLPPAELQRRSQVLIGPLGSLPVMGDDVALDRITDAVELALDAGPRVRWDDAALLGRRALLTLDAELQAALRAGAPASSTLPPPPAGPAPALPPVAYGLIMDIRPFDAGALPALPMLTAPAAQLALALVDAGEGGLAINAAAAVATAAAAREPTLLAALAPQLSARSARLLLALAGGYLEPGMRILSEPFDRAQACWCLGGQPPAPPGLAGLYAQAYRAFRAANPGRAAVERAWVDCLQAYSDIYQHGALTPLPWHEVLAIVMLPGLYQELINACAAIHQLAAGAAAPIPSCALLCGTRVADAYRGWVLAGGSPPVPTTVVLAQAGPLDPARLRLIGALWLMDRCLDDITGIPATTAIQEARSLSASLEPLRTLAVGLPGSGVADEEIAALAARLTSALTQASAARAALLAIFSGWHLAVAATPDQDGWNLTALRTRRYCAAIASLAEALADEHAEHAVLDCLAMQRDVAAVLGTTMRSAVVVGSPLLCDHIRATRIGAYLVACDLSAQQHFSVGPIPAALLRPLVLPPRGDDEPEAIYWQRVCLTVIFPSFSANALESTLTALVPVWLRMRAGATRQGSLALDHLGLCAWTIHALAQSGKGP